MEFAKCSDRYSSGRPVYLANFDGSRVEEFVTSTVFAGISGASGSLFAEAIAEGADCLLTGEANHHHALDAKRLGLSLIAAGHYATEFPVTAAVAAALRTALPELEVLVSTENRDPYTYL